MKILGEGSQTSKLRRIFVSVILSVLIVASVSGVLNIASKVYAYPGTCVYVNPSLISDSTTTTHVGDSFSVTLNYGNMTGLAGIEYTLYWNNTVLSVTNVHDTLPWSGAPFIATNTTTNDYNATFGQMNFVAASISGSVSGSKAFRTVTFKILVAPPAGPGNSVSSVLAFGPYNSETIFGDSGGNTIPLTDGHPWNGMFTLSNPGQKPKPTPPEAAFTFSPGYPYVNGIVTFNATASSGVGGATIVSYSWNFGDGMNGVGVIASHVYHATNNYTVTLNVTDNNGLSNTTSHIVPCTPTLLANLYVNPPSRIDPTLTPSTTFTTDINIKNITNLYGYRFSLWYDTSFLNGIGVVVYPYPSSEVHFHTLATIDDKNGHISINVTYYSPANAINSIVTPLTLATITFQVRNYGACTLHLNDTKLVDMSGNPINHIATDGFVAISLPHVGILSVSAAPTTVFPGIPVNVTIVAANLGIWRTETFNVTAYANSTAIGTATVTNLAPKTNATLTIGWDTTGTALGNYLISARASVVSLETNMTGHYLADGIVQVLPRPHVGLIKVSANPMITYAGTNVNVTVVAANFGSLMTETFNVTAYANSTAIGTYETVTNLAPMTNTTLYFDWNTVGVSLGNYLISARASMVPYETNTTSHYVTDGSVRIIAPAVAVLSVKPDLNDIYQGWKINVTVVVQNQGIAPISFDVAAYYATNTIGTQHVTALAAGANATLKLLWDTTLVPYNAYYNISAKVLLSPGEVNTISGMLLDGKVRIRIMGDVNGDGQVNVLDLIKVSAAFETLPGNPKYNFYADVNRDGAINVLDMIIVSTHLGLH